MKNKITVVILTKNEEKNISHAIKSAKQIADRIVVVDCGSSDRTIELAKEAGAEAVYHPWCGHAKQFNWAINNVNVQTDWIFRLDADERISKELALEINLIMSMPIENNVNGFEMRWRIYFMDKWIRHGGTHKPYFLRLFRFGSGHVEEQLMDEHIVVSGIVIKLKGDLIHYDYKGLDSWLTKHINYSNLEIQMYLTDSNNKKTAQIKKRKPYYKIPQFFRARLYYWFRYYLELGFLDGREGQIFIYLQSYWYRYLIDAKMFEMQKENTNGREP